MAPITFAHRGGRADHEENTLVAFAAAKARGATGVESDVHLAADGEPVLIHEPYVRRGLRRLRVAATPSADLSPLGIPTLRQLYGEIGPHLHVSLDLKDRDAGEAVLAVAADVGRLDRLWLCSPDLDVLAPLRQRAGAVRLVHSTRKRAVSETMERHAATLAEQRVDAFNMHRVEWTRGLVTLFHRFEVKAFAWDAQEVRHLREVLRHGVDAVYSDHVDRMVAVVGEFAESDAEGPGERPGGTRG